MRKILFCFLTLAVLFGCKTSGPAPEELEIVPVPSRPKPHEPFAYAANGNISIRFNISYFPTSYKTVELIWNNQYQGYFDLQDIIYLPRLTGRQPLIATFADINGNPVGSSKTYYIEVK